MKFVVLLFPLLMLAQGAQALNGDLLWCTNLWSDDSIYLTQGPEFRIIPSGSEYTLKISTDYGDSVSYRLNTKWISQNMSLEVSDNSLNFVYGFFGRDNYKEEYLKISSSTVYIKKDSIISFKSISIELAADKLLPSAMNIKNKKFKGGSCLLDTSLLPKQ